MRKILPSPIQDLDDSEMSECQPDFGEACANRVAKIRDAKSGTRRSLSPRLPFTIHECAVGCSWQVRESHFVNERAIADATVTRRKSAFAS